MVSFSLLVFTVLISIGVLLVMFRPASRIGLVDSPVGRKQHVGTIPLTGGISIAAGVLVSVGIHRYPTNFWSDENLSFLLATALLILGMLDDMKNLSWRQRLIGQVVVSTISVSLLGLYVHHIGEVTLTNVPGLSICFTVLAIVGLTNAFNLIDGVDGLCGSFAILSIINIFLFSGFKLTVDESAKLILVITATLPYLVFNLFVGKNLKVFLGDSGSYFLGFIVAMSLLKNSQGINPTLSYSSVLWCSALPVIETIGTMLRRLYDGKSPFHPDRRHLHYLLISRGVSPRLTLSLLIGAGVMLSILGLAIEWYSPKLSVPLFLLTLISTTTAIQLFENRIDNGCCSDSNR
jgi:undecaprenyl-phosphate alpha-N-acetylglucosaminyl 1-phosphatetransferase